MFKSENFTEENANMYTYIFEKVYKRRAITNITEICDFICEN